MKDAQPTFYHHFIGFRKFTTELTNLRREPVHVVFLRDNYYFFVQKTVVFYKNTRETGSARGKPVQHGKPVRAVLVQVVLDRTSAVLMSIARHWIGALSTFVAERSNWPVIRPTSPSWP